MNHRQMLEKGGIDNFSNYLGEIVPDNFEAVCGRSRDSKCLERSNFECFLKRLGGESESVQVHRFGHWAVGWIEELFVDKNSDKWPIAVEILAEIEDYPVINEEHFYQLESEEAQEVWEKCYDAKERIEYLREHSYVKAECNSFSDLLSAVRGKWFPGDASDMLY